LGRAKRTPNVPLAASSTRSTTVTGAALGPSDRRLWPDLRPAADVNFVVEGNRQEHFDAKLIDLCECQDRGLLIAILAGIEEPTDLATAMKGNNLALESYRTGLSPSLATN
jgi:hypothetical protein